MAEAVDLEDSEIPEGTEYYETADELQCLISKIMEVFKDTLNQSDMKKLTTEEEAWKAFIEEAGLSSEAEAALRSALKKDTTDDKAQAMNFQEALPELEKTLKKHLKKLHRLADNIDEEHKNFTISNVVTDSTSATSGVLGLLGLILAPFTVGSSLALSAAGLVLGTVSTVADFTSTAVEETRRKSNEEEARRLVSTARDLTNDISVLLFKMSKKASRTTKDVIKTLKELGKYVRALRVARMIVTGRIPVQRAGQVWNAFQGTVLSMTRGARVRGAVFGAAFLALDVYGIVTNSMHLQEGAKSGLAEALRQVAQELKEKWEELIEFHKTL